MGRQEEFEDTKGVIRAVNRISTDTEEGYTRIVWKYNRSNQGRTRKKDIQEELEYTKAVIRAVQR
jgi:hypothetical protein